MHHPCDSTVSPITIGLQVPAPDGQVPEQNPAGNALQTACASFSIVWSMERLLPK